MERMLLLKTLEVYTCNKWQVDDAINFEYLHLSTLLLITFGFTIVKAIFIFFAIIVGEECYYAIC